MWRCVIAAVCEVHRSRACRFNPHLLCSKLGIPNEHTAAARAHRGRVGPPRLRCCATAGDTAEAIEVLTDAATWSEGEAWASSCWYNLAHAQIAAGKFRTCVPGPTLLILDSEGG